ncbi:hypothetical protein TSUD_170400 [Trifolium subterraneum]|uniref:Uncharacterized protein n=1 Tax=Trifolium subterraneum TaxID=3900 RepID=A0A2Z6MUI9_TRISU|nr:hypothetical protein TSUD_170400 [Trifolium subterraneum]
MSKAYEGFGKNSGPGSISLRSRIVFGPNNHPFPSSPSITSTTPPPSWVMRLTGIRTNLKIHKDADIDTYNSPLASSIESHGSSDGQNLGAQPTESMFSFSSIKSHGSSDGQNLGAQPTERRLLFSLGSIESHGSSDGQNLGAQPTESLIFSFGSIESHGSSNGQNLGAQPTESPTSVTTFIASGGSTTGITAKDEKEVIESSS